MIVSQDVTVSELFVHIQVKNRIKNLEFCLHLLECITKILKKQMSRS